MAEMDAKTLKEFDDRLKSMVGTLGELEGNIKAVGTAITNSFGTATQNMVKEVQQAFRGIQMSDMLGVDLAKRDIQELNKEIAILEGNIKTKTSNGTASYSPKKNKWVYTKGNEKLTDEGEVEAIEKLNRLNEKLKYSMMSREELMLRLKQTSGKMYSDEQRDLKKLQQEYYNYEQRVKIAAQNIDAYKKSGSDSQQTKDQITFWKKQSDDYTTLMKSAQDRIKEYREKGIKLSLEEEERMRLAQLEKLNRIENNKLGYASKEWKKETSQRTKRNADLDKRADEYRKSIEALTKAELELAQAEDNLRQKQAGKANGQQYAESTIRSAEKDIVIARQNIINAENEVKSFGASLASLKGGAQRLNEIRAAFGLIAESGDDLQNIPTVFDRIISDINAKAQKGGEELSKKLTDANTIRSEAQRSFEAIKQEYDKAIGGINPMGATALANMGKVDPQMLSSAARKRYLKQQQEEAARLSGGPSLVSPELIRRQELAQQTLNAAMQRYNDLLQQVNAQQEKYTARVEAIQGVSEKYQKISDQIQALRDRFAELYVKKEAKLIDDEKFKAQSDAIIKRYEELVRERDKFEKGQDIDMAVRSKMEEEQRLAQIRKDNAKSRVQDEKNAERLILQEQRKRAAEEKASAREKINAAKNANQQEYKTIQEQIRLNRQITDLWRNYRQLQSNTPKNKWGYTTELVDAKNKLRELLALSKELEMVTPGSRKIASQYLEYEKINNKLKEINRQHKEQSVSLDEILKKAQHIGAAFGFMFSLQGVVNFGKKLIDTTGTFEKQFVAIRQIIGDTDAATEIWNKTMQQALQSPFKAMQLVDYTKKLAAYQIETEKLFDTTKRLADVSAGLGVEMQRLILAYGQVKAANYLRASEIRQFNEAGLNILGELSTYFTKVNGKLYTTADVMEMVTKRMVKFEDVEAIFKRITDEGGIFYNMQEVQADTVWGQIQKLHDAYDQMLNTIGSSNNGALRDAIELINKLVRNWKDLAVALQINIGTLAPFWAYTKLVSTGWSKFSDIMVTYTEKTKAGTKITHKMTAELLKQKLQAESSGMAWAAWGKKLRLAILNVRMSWLALRSAFRSFLPFLIVEGVVAIATAIINANKELRDFQNAMSELSTGAAGNLKKEREEFKALREEIEKTTAGTENRRKAVDKMNSQYGEYLNNLVNEKMTVEELRKAYEGVEQAMVNAANIKLRKSIEDKKTESITKLQQDMIEDIKGEKIFEKQTTSGIFGNATNNAYIGEDATNKQAVALVEQYTEAVEKAVKKKKRKLTDKELQSLAVDVYNKYLGKNIEFYDKNIDILTDLVQRGEDIANIMAEKMPRIGFETEHQENMWDWGVEAWDRFLEKQEYVVNGERVNFKKQQEDLKSHTNNLEEYRAKLQVFINQYEKYADRYANALYKITGFKPDELPQIDGKIQREHFTDSKVEQKTLAYEKEMEKKGLKYLEDKYKNLGPYYEYSDKYLEAAKLQLASDEDLAKGSREYDKSIKELYKDQKEYLDWMESKKNDFSKDEVKKQKEYVQGIVDLAKRRNIDLSDVFKKKGSVQKESVSSMVSLLKEMNDEYNKLSKSAYGFSKSQEKVKSSFESAFKEVYKGLGMKKGEGMILSFDKTDFTTKTGLASAYEQLLAYVTAPERIGKYTKEAASQIEKALADVRASIGVDVQVRIREDFEREMEDAFNNYELTLDLQKLNLPSDLMEDMFNIESVDMTTLRQKITDFYNELKAAGDDVDRTDMEKIEQYIKKIDDMEKKARRDRIKEYAKYLEYELSERAKISMDYAKKIADVQTERSIPVDKRDKIIAGLIKERDEKLAKQDWEDFKGSEVYVQMMEDLEKHGTAALKSMREELELIRKNAKNLSPRALKEVVNAIEKIREIELNRVDPFTGLRKSIANVKESLAEAGVSSKKELYAEAAANEKNLVLTQRRKQEVDRIVAAQNRAVEIQKELNDLTKYKEISDIVYNSDIPVEKEIDAFQDLLKKYEDDFNKLSDEDKKLVKERLALAKEMGRLNDEASKDTTTSARKEEIKARATEIENRVKEIDKLLDGTVIGQNIANGIIDAIKRVIELKGEFMGISSEDLANVNAKKEQKELSETEKRLQSLQNKYNKAIQDIDNYNKQVQRLVSKISEWAGVVQGLWSDITNMSSAYEGGFGKWMNRWGKVFDVSLQQVSKLSKAFGDFRNTMAEVEKSATKAAADKALGELGNVAEAENTAKENENTDAINRNTTSRADNTVNVIANTAAIKANTEAKIENANAGNTNGGNNNGDNVKEAAKGLVESTNSINKSTETASEVGSTVATNSNTTATEANTAAKQANAAASGLASAGNTAVGATAEAATPAVATFGSTLMAVMGWVGLITAGLSALMSVITSIAGAHDDDIEEDIEREQRKIDELKRAYERLEKQIQKTWSSFDYMDTYDRQVENIKRQIEATERQLALERDKKDTDESKIISYQEAIDDAYDELDELKQKQIEVFGGIGEEGYRSAAEGFVDAWKEAFLETGDGLQGLQDHFDEFLQEWFVKQATMRIAGNMLERTFRMIDDSVNKSSEGGVSVTMAELQAIRDEFAAQAPLISEALEDLAGMFDLQGEGGLSGLAAGIQGMTEEQANILEAYWNSVRMYTANIDINVERIASILGAGGINTNPMLDKLDSIINNTSYIKRIYDMLEPLQTNNGNGRGFRTYNL